ncbi:MAG: molybdopterin-binding protein [Oscillospiraceae bacterium]
MPKIIAVCQSPAKGTAKVNIHHATLRAQWGMEGDAHAGDWHRQVSLLCHEKVVEFRAKGVDVADGAFGENLLIEGIDFPKLPIGTKFYIGTAVLELTQIGKQCHSHCEIFKAVGDCIMPREGVFTRVLEGGEVSEGDEVTYTLPFKTAIVTVSDSGFEGTRKDQSGPALEQLLKGQHYPVVSTTIVPDDEAQIASELTRLCDENLADFILTTGGTGLSPRDVTPEATRSVFDRDVPGISEAMRASSMQITPRGMLSRGVSGIRKGTLIVNLPGSPKAATECLSAILPAMDHALASLKGTVTNCATPL